MGTNSLPTAIGGAIIPPTDHNALVEALTQVLVPRNSSGNAADAAGSLGSSIYRWNFLYIVQAFVGAASSNLKIYEPTTGVLRIEKPNNDYIELADGEARFYMDGVKRFSVNDNGIDWTTQDDDSIPLSKVNAYLFQSRVEVPISGSGSGATTVYTLPYDAYVAVEVEAGDFDDSGIHLYTDILQAGTNDAWERHTLLYTLDNDTGDAPSGVKKYSGVYRSGQAFVLARSSTTTGITLHVFRL